MFEQHVIVRGAGQRWSWVYVVMITQRDVSMSRILAIDILTDSELPTNESDWKPWLDGALCGALTSKDAPRLPPLKLTGRSGRRD